MFKDTEILELIKKHQNITSETCNIEERMQPEYKRFSSVLINDFINKLHENITVFHKIVYTGTDHVELKCELLFPKELNFEIVKDEELDPGVDFHKFQLAEDFIIYISFFIYTNKFRAESDKFKYPFSDYAHLNFCERKMHSFIISKIFYQYKDCKKREIKIDEVYLIDGYKEINMETSAKRKETFMKFIFQQEKPSDEKIAEYMKMQIDDFQVSYNNFAAEVKLKYLVDITDIEEILKIFNEDLTKETKDIIIKVNDISYIELKLYQKVENKEIYAVGLQSANEIIKIFEIFENNVTINYIRAIIHDLTLERYHEYIFNNSFFIGKGNIVKDVFENYYTEEKKQ